VLLAAAPLKHDLGQSSQLSAKRFCKSLMATHCLLVQDFRRAGAEYASAIFIIAPKYPEDPTTADRYLTMCALSLGQYLQEVHVSLEERLSHTPNSVMHWIKHGTVSAPHFCQVPLSLASGYVAIYLPDALVLFALSVHSSLIVNRWRSTMQQYSFHMVDERA
jgi:hypothetical protein